MAKVADGSVRRCSGVSARSNLSSREAFTPQLFASHLRNKGFEIRARQFFADVRQPARQVFSHGLFSGFMTLGIGVRPAQDINPTRSCNYPCNRHLPHMSTKAPPKRRGRKRGVRCVICLARGSSDVNSKDAAMQLEARQPPWGR